MSVVKRVLKKSGTVRERQAVSFTTPELLYKIFRKKACPNCASKMRGFKEKEDKGVMWDVENGLRRYKGVNAPLNAKLYYYKQFYACDCCNRNYSIGELAERKKER